jgi:hypothetical protein
MEDTFALTFAAGCISTFVAKRPLDGASFA